MYINKETHFSEQAIDVLSYFIVLALITSLRQTAASIRFLGML